MRDPGRSAARPGHSPQELTGEMVAKCKISRKSCKLQQVTPAERGITSQNPTKPMKTRISLFHRPPAAALAAVAFAMTATAHAATFTWTGATSPSWVPNTGNWNPNPAVFGSTADLVLNTVPDGNMFLGFGRTVRSISFGADIDSNVGVSFQTTAGGTAAANLTFDTDAVGGNATVAVAAGATGNITLGNSLGGTNGNPILLDNLVVDHNGSGLLLFNRPFQAAAFGITKTGTGTMQTNNNNLLTGPLNLNQGTLIANTFGQSGDVGTFSSVNLNGGTLQVNHNSDVATLKSYTNPFTVTAASKIAFFNSTSSSESFSLAGTATLALTPAAADLTVQNISSDTSLNNSIGIDRNITGAGDLIVDTYNNINGGTASFGLGRVGIGGVNSGWSGALDIRKGTAQVTGNYATADMRLGTGDIILGTTGDSFGAGLLLSADNLNGNKAYTNNITVRSGGFRTIRGGSDHSYTFSGSIALEGDLNVHNGLFFTDKNMILTGNISGVGGLSITESGNPGFTRLSGNNTYSGATTIGSGAVLNILSASGNSIGDSSALSFAGAGATLVFNSTNETIGSLASTGTNGFINLGGNTLTTGSLNTDTNYGGTISGTSGGLTKVGSGSMELTNTNGFTGQLQVNGGRLVIGASGTVNSTSGVSIGAGEFRYNSSTALSQAVSFTTTGGTLSGTGPITPNVNVTIGNALAVGNGGIGSMPFNGALTIGGTFSYELNSGTHTADLGDVAGNLVLSGILDLVQLGTYAAGDKFTLLSYDGTLSGVFSGIADDTNFTDGGGLWTMNYNDTVAGLNGGVSASNTYVTITAVPELNVAALLGGLGTLALPRRRRA